MKLFLCSFFALSTLFFATSCRTTHDEAQGEGRVRNLLSPDQVARQFFAAYRDYNKAAARRVSSKEVVNLLDWSARRPRGANLSLGGHRIYNGEKVIEMIIHSDGHVGANIVELEITH